MKFHWIGLDAPPNHSMGVVNNENRRALGNLGWTEVPRQEDADVVFSFMHQGGSVPDLSGRKRVFYICSTTHNSIVKEFVPNYLAISRTPNNYVFLCNHDGRDAFAKAGVVAHVWNHGVNLDEFKPGAPPPEHPLTFGFVGQGSPFKRHRLLVDAFLNAFGDDPEEARLRLLMGWGSVEGYPETPDNVELLPMLPRDRMPDFYRSLHCLANFSWGESFNLTLLEALACGVPCLVADMPSMYEAPYDRLLTRIRATRTIKPEILVGCFFAPKDPSRYAEPPWVYDVALRDAISALLDFEAHGNRQGRIDVPPSATWEARIRDQVLPAILG